MAESGPIGEAPEHAMRNARRAELWRKRLHLEHVRREAHHHRRGLTFKERFMDTAVWLLNAGLRATGLYWLGMRNARRFVLREFDLALEGLPKQLDGLRLLHVSDLHFGSQPGFLDAVCAFLRPVRCDVCVITGDYRYGRLHGEADVREGVDRVAPCLNAKYGVFAVLGNHDDSDFADWLRAAGIRVLVNEWTAVDHRGARCYIAGVDDPHMFRCADVELALEGLDPKDFCVLLAHSAEAIDAAAGAGVDLYLCGHTHAGQVCLPRIGPVFLNSRAGRAFAAGWWRQGAMVGYTTAGIGTTELPVRFLCPPEAALITLRAKFMDEMD